MKKLYLDLYLDTGIADFSTQILTVHHARWEEVLLGAAARVWGRWGFMFKVYQPENLGVKRHWPSLKLWLDIWVISLHTNIQRRVLSRPDGNIMQRLIVLEGSFFNRYHFTLPLYSTNR